MLETIILAGIKTAVAAATITVTVTPGQTLSGIAQEYHVPGGGQALCAANHLADCDLIYAGQTLVIPGSSGGAAVATPSGTAAPASGGSSSSAAPASGGSSSSAAPASGGSSFSAGQAGGSSSSSTARAPASSPSSTVTATGGSGGFSVPGVPNSLTTCIASRESNNLQDPAANGNAYGILPGSGYNVAGMSLAQQKQVFQEIYHSVGASAWSWDGCPGT